MMTVIAPLRAGERLKQGDLMQRADGKLYPVVDWKNRTAQGSMYYREFEDLAPVGACVGTSGEFAIIDCNVQPRTHVYYRLAEERDIGKIVRVSDFVLTQNHLNNITPPSCRRLKAVRNEGQGNRVFRTDGDDWYFAYVREEIPIVSVVASRKVEFRIATEGDIGKVCYFDDLPCTPDMLRRYWDNEVMGGRYRETLFAVFYGDKRIYQDSHGANWRFAWVPVE